MAENNLIVTLKNPETVLCPNCKQSFEIKIVKLVIAEDAQMIDGCVLAQAIVHCSHCNSMIKGACEVAFESRISGKNISN